MSEKERVLTLLRALPGDVTMKEIVRRFEAATGIKFTRVYREESAALRRLTPKERLLPSSLQERIGARDLILRGVSALPENATTAEVAENVELIAAIEEALDEVEQGYYYTEEEVLRYLEECLPG